LETLLALPNIELVHTYFRFRLLADEDDNKFVDCAVAANAKYLVGEDRDFRILQKVAFPKIDVIRLELFKEKLISKSL
jgi:predicted nucleic acid-binding protein